MEVPIKSENRYKRSSMSPITGNKKRPQDKRLILPSQIHGRWLVESNSCARVLGPAGKRLKHMKLKVNENDLNVWISTNIPNSKFRVFNCIGTPFGVSKFAALFVRSLFEEFDNFATTLPTIYDFKLLVPIKFKNEIDLQLVANKSGAKMLMDSKQLGESDELLLHINGYADSIQVACYTLLKHLKELFQQFDFQSINLFCPELLELDFDDKFRYLEPLIQKSSKVSENIHTAFDIARDSKRDKIRQVVQVPKSSLVDTLVKNISSCTECKVQLVDVCVGNDYGVEEVSVEIEGRPGENLLALFLVYRFLTSNEVRC